MFAILILLITTLGALVVQMHYQERSSRILQRTFPSPLDAIRASRAPMLNFPGTIKTQPAPSPTPITESETTQARATSREVAAPNTPASNLLDVCRTGWETLAESEPSRLQTDLLDRRLLIPRECLLRMRDEVPTEVVQAFIDDCQTTRDDLDAAEFERRCLPRLTQFRAFVTRELDDATAESSTLQGPALEESLTTRLQGGTVNLAEASKADLDQNIALADSLIAENPDSYIAYKGKLLSLLLREVKYEENVDPAVYEALYEELLRFQGPTERDRFLASLRAGDQDGAAEMATDTGRREALELQGMDADLVQIPFLRMKATGDIEGLADMAADYIEAYPNSYLGYLYLAEAMWDAGESAAAMDLVKQALGSDISDASALHILEQIAARPAVDRIAEMGRD